MGSGKRRGCASRGCGGRSGFVFLALLALAVWYAATGHYQPRIPPPPALPNPNAFDDYTAAGALLRQNLGKKRLTASNSGPPNLADERTLVANNQAALARLRVGLTRSCVVPIKRDFGELYPYLSDVRDLARLLAAEADVRAASGDHAGAAASSVDGIQLGQDLSRGGPVTHGLTSASMQSIARQPIIRLVDRLSASDCDRLADRLERLLRTRVTAAAVVEEERNYVVGALANFDPAHLPATMTDEDDPQSPTDSRFGQALSAWHFMRDRTLRDLEQYFDSEAREAVKPTVHRIPTPEPGFFFARMFIPVFAGVSDRLDQNDAENRLLLCMLRIRAYRLNHGKLPAVLSDMKLCPSLTTDPYTGKPLTYRPAGGDYLLYALGPDGKDDGGIPIDTSLPSNPVAHGDAGVRPFRSARNPGQYVSFNRRVPHMLPPKLPSGAPPLLPSSHNPNIRPLA